MYKIIVDHEKCTKCGLCSKDCTNFVLALAGDKIIELNNHCIECGHCSAICPVGAITLKSNGGPQEPDLADIETYNAATFSINPEHFLKQIKFRRSIRHYQARPVEEDKLRQIIEAGRYTATAVNTQNVSYVVLRQEAAKFQYETMVVFRKIARFFSHLNPLLHLPVDFKKLARAKDSFLFKEAPAVILVISSTPINATLAAANMETMANALGLGVLHVGFFTTIANWNLKIRRMLGLKFNQRIVNCLCVGYPAVKYQRTAPRRPAKIEWR